MKRWPRVLSLVAFAIIAVCVVTSTVSHERYASLGIKLIADGDLNNGFVVADRPSHGPLHRGDRISFGNLIDAIRYGFVALPLDRSVPVTRTSPIPQAELKLAPRIASEPVIARVITIAAVLLFIGVAALVVARGRSDGSLQFAWFFAVIVSLVNPTLRSWPDWLFVAYVLYGSVAAPLSFYLAIDFATRLGEDGGARWARRLRRLAGTITAVAVVAGSFATTLQLLTPRTPLWLQRGQLVLLVLLAVLLIVATRSAFVHAAAGDRQRIFWIVISLAVGVTGFASGIACTLLGIPEIIANWFFLLLPVMPIGCAYAILRYRVLDIAFVINRATVFGITSLIVLAAVAGIDVALQTLLRSMLIAHDETYVHLAIAFAVGIATRPVHERVDHVVDDLFFRKRHEAERVLHAFARDVAYIDNSGVVASRTTRVIAHATAATCAMYLQRGDVVEFAAHDGEGENVPLADRDDPAVVRMLATRAAVDLHDVETALRGDVAFPMFARHRFAGFVVCGAKSDGTAYAPDEIEALANTVHAAGLALDLLRIEALERELSVLRRGETLPSLTASVAAS